MKKQSRNLRHREAQLMVGTRKGACLFRSNERRRLVGTSRGPSAAGAILGDGGNLTGL